MKKSDVDMQCVCVCKSLLSVSNLDHSSLLTCTEIFSD